MLKVDFILLAAGKVDGPAIGRLGGRGRAKPQGIRLSMRRHRVRVRGLCSTLFVEHRGVDEAGGSVAPAVLRAARRRVAERWGPAAPTGCSTRLLVVQVGVPPAPMLRAETAAPLGRIAEGCALRTPQGRWPVLLQVPPCHLRLTPPISHVNVAGISVVRAAQRLASGMARASTGRSKGRRPTAVCHHAHAADSAETRVLRRPVLLT